MFTNHMLHNWEEREGRRERERERERESSPRPHLVRSPKHVGNSVAEHIVPHEEKEQCQKRSPLGVEGS